MGALAGRGTGASEDSKMAPPTLILGIHLGDELALCIWQETPLSVQQVVLRMTKKSLLTSLSVTPEHPDS